MLGTWVPFGLAERSLNCVAGLVAEKNIEKNAELRHRLPKAQQVGTIILKPHSGHAEKTVFSRAPKLGGNRVGKEGVVWVG